jgi:hypothetical protein
MRSYDISSDDFTRRFVGYRKERMEKNDKESRGIIYWIMNQNLNSIRIKDLPMVY